MISFKIMTMINIFILLTLVVLFTTGTLAIGYIADTKSMEPYLTKDHTVYLTNKFTIKEGNIYTYNYNNISVIHRVVKVYDDGYILFKGDNNPDYDPLVRKEDVTNKLLFKIKRFI